MLLNPGPGVVAVAGLRQAWRHKRRFDAVITLEDPGCRSADQLRFHRAPAPSHVVMAFEDVDDDTVGVQVASAHHVARAIEFAREHQQGSLLVHCRHGVGRSAAIALAVLADRMGAGNEALALQALLAVRPEATPNLVVVKLADEELGRNGALLAALRAWEAVFPAVAEARALRAAFLAKNPQLYAWR